MLKLFIKFSLGSILAAVVSFFTTPITTALFLPEEFGIASIFITVQNLLMQVIVLGNDQSLVRFFYQKEFKDDIGKLISNVVIVPVILCVIVACGVWLCGQPLSMYLVKSYNPTLIWVLIATLFAALLERFTLLLLRMLQYAGSFSALKLVGAVVNFLVTIAYAYNVSKSFMAILMGLLVSMLVTSIIAIIITRKYWKFSNFSRQTIKASVIYGLPYLPTFIASWLFEGVDKMMLKSYSGDYQLGLFSAAYKFVAILSLLQIAFTTFWTPVSMELYEKNSTDAQQKFTKVFQFMLAVMMIGAVGLITIKPLVIKLFASTYTEVMYIMPFLLLVPVMYTLSEITVGGINFAKKTFWHLVIAVAISACNALLCYIFIPKYGAKGAAMATGLSYIMFYTLRTYLSNQYFKIKVGVLKNIITICLLVTCCFVNTFYIQSNITWVCNLTILGTLCILFFTEIKNNLTNFLLNKFN